ncbi:MAG TPA: trigger factor [Candidatus Fimimorpha faecalis]|uniref:Trigger factor n=1 Tax=Candidatus Fimimorpha faecalis TaxID=2840824 RepID=A0A9D1EDW8_9FIRM|nr:trigger factor [Candidatus Fimimorpha faecalis]
MSVQVEKLEKNMAKLTIEVPAAEFEAAIQEAYLKNKKRISLPGFRKGKVPRMMIEKMYGEGFFYEDAANAVIPKAYEKAAMESEIEIVSRPEINVEQIGKGKDFIFTATVAVKPEVTLGQYKGLEYDEKPVEVTDEDLEQELKKVQEQNARTITVEDRAIANGDIAVIDFTGSVDGEEFEGGKGEDYELVIGSHSFIDTFEDQLIGKNTGDEVEVNVTFPEDYQVADLAGKPALFKVVIKAIKTKEVPELDDEFASDVSDFDTLDEYKEDLKKTILEKKEKAAKTAKENALVDKVIENAQMDIPEPMIELEVRQMADEFAQRMQMQGLSMEQYMQYTGLTSEKLLEEMKPNAEKKIKTRLVLEAVVDAEKIEVSAEELEAEYKKLADMYQMEVDKVKEIMGTAGEENMKKDIAVQKAVDVIADSAK